LDLGRQSAFELIECRAGLQRRHCIDQIAHGLCLHEIESTSQVSAEREFSGLREPRPGIDRGFDDLAEQHRASMCTDLHDMLAGVGVRSGEPGDDRLIRERVGGADARKRRMPRRQLVVRATDRARDFYGRGPADADHADAAPAWRRRDGDDRVIRRECHRSRAPAV
jgi:hypothetical protein